MTIDETRKAGRPRSVQSHSAILEATLLALSEEGFTAMTIEGIAARAQVGKATIYRRWPSKEALAVDALRELHAEMPVIDTGSIRQDLLSLLQSGLRVAEQHPRAEQLALKLVGEMESNPDLFRVFASQVITPRLSQITELLQRAQARGEVRPEIDPLFVLSLLAGSLFYYRTFVQSVSAHELTPPSVEQVVDTILRGIGTI